MRVIEHLKNNGNKTAFSFEILPPLKGNSIEKVYNIIDKLREFDPKYINITSHRSEMIFKEMPDGSFRPQKMRKRPGSVAIASAIQMPHAKRPISSLTKSSLSKASRT